MELLFCPQKNWPIKAIGYDSVYFFICCDFGGKITNAIYNATFSKFLEFWYRYFILKKKTLAVKASLFGLSYSNPPKSRVAYNM